MATSAGTGPDPLRITSLNGPWPLHGVAASRRIEAAAQGDLPAGTLMDRAGLAVARMARAAWPFAHRVQVWCGPGNNGGDGWVAARYLQAWGCRVQVVELGAPERMPADAREARRAALQAGVAASHLTEPAADALAPQLLIDGLLGLGANRAPSGDLAAALARLRGAAAPVLAIDLPSALDAESGQPLGPDAVRADLTLSLLTLKPGLFTGAGRDHAGAVWFDGLGTGAAAMASSTFVPADAWLSGPPALRSLPHATHKGSRGDLLVIGGAPGFGGAAWLAARAALAAGAGRTYLSLLAEASVPAFDPMRPELMLRPRAWEDLAFLQRATVVCGCGGGAPVREVLASVLMHSARLVLDADALNAVAAQTPLRVLLQGRAGRGQPTVLTPHPLEAARLLGWDTTRVQAQRLLAAAHLAQSLHTVALLKGSGSVVASTAGTPCINPTGNATLATAGTGDVLAGWLGGLWAQRPLGRTDETGADPATLAAQAAWQHGRAAELAAPADGRQPLLAADLIGAMQALA